MSIREVEDWGFDAEETRPTATALPPALIEHKVERRAKPPAREPAKKPAYVAMLLIVALEILWLAFFGYWLLRLVS